MAHVSLFHQVVNRTESFSVKLMRVELVKIRSCESLAPAGEMKVRRMEGTAVLREAWATLPESSWPNHAT